MNFASTAALSLAMSTDAFAAAIGKGAALIVGGLVLIGIGCFILYEHTRPAL